MHRIGIISDTHGLLRPEVAKMLRGCEAILHGGDLGNEDILKELNNIAPVYAVRGNNDDFYLPETLSLELHGIRFFITHIKKTIPEDTVDADVIIYGHSHKYEEVYAGSQLWLNPGSCGPKRFTLPVTMAVLEIEKDGIFHVKKIDLGKIENIGSHRNGKQVPNIKKAIELVMRDTKKGIPVGKIADKHGISRELAEQICRLYLTHPGVDADGIMRKMGL